MDNIRKNVTAALCAGKTPAEAIALAFYKEQLKRISTLKKPKRKREAPR